MANNGRKQTKPQALPDPIPAFRRAAKRALEEAKRTGTPCIVEKDGKLVDIAAPKKRATGKK
jgi:hypothetical protein